MPVTALDVAPMPRVADRRGDAVTILDDPDVVTHLHIAIVGLRDDNRLPVVLLHRHLDTALASATADVDSDAGDGAADGANRPPTRAPATELVVAAPIAAPPAAPRPPPTSVPLLTPEPPPRTATSRIETATGVAAVAARCRRVDDPGCVAPPVWFRHPGSPPVRLAPSAQKPLVRGYGVSFLLESLVGVAPDRPV